MRVKDRTAVAVICISVSASAVFAAPPTGRGAATARGATDPSQTAAGAVQAPAAAPHTPAPVYPPGVQEVLTGMSAEVTAGKQLFDLGRSADRLLKIRTAFLNELLIRAKPGSVDDKPSHLDLKNGEILCSVRGEHALIAGEQGYLTAVVSGIQAVAKPSADITSLGGAVGSLFEEYAVKVADPLTPPKIIAQATKPCLDELELFPDYYYGKFSKPSETTVEPQNFVFAIIPFIALLSSLSAIITPVATAAATDVDAERRKNAIIQYFESKKEGKAHRDQIYAAMDNTSAKLATFAMGQRMLALGQFSEAMANIRASSIDPLKIDACKQTLPTTYKALDGSPAVDHRSDDEFLTCYQQAWKPLAEPVAAALKAADLYDQYADAAPPNHEKLMSDLKGQLNQIGEQHPATVKDIWNELTQLAALATTIDNALSPANRAKATQAIEAMVKGQ
jgi:hypothetical protein